MKAEPHRSFFPSTVILTVLLCSCVSVSAQTSDTSQLNETDAFTAVTLAQNPTARLAAAEEFLSAHAGSKLRKRVLELVVEQFQKLRNPSVALVLIDRARKVFTRPEEQTLLDKLSFEAFTYTKRAGESFELGQEILKSEPNNLPVLSQLVHAGTKDVKRQDRKQNEQLLQYGLRAISIIESGNKPDSLDQLIWAEQLQNLGTLYQQTGILELALGQPEAAKLRLTRSTELSPRDPYSHALLGRLLNNEYQTQKVTYDSLPVGDLKKERLNKLQGDADRIIESFARATALATGQREFQLLIQQVVPDLTSLYRQRHGSTDGLQQLINRFRAPGNN